MLIKHWNVWNIIAFIFLAALLVFTRDANAYMSFDGWSNFIILGGIQAAYFEIFTYRRIVYYYFRNFFRVVFRRRSLLFRSPEHCLACEFCQIRNIGRFLSIKGCR